MMSELTKQKITGALLNYKKKRIENKWLIPSAVLLLIFCDEEQCHVLFTQRSKKVNLHKGEFCFPGGTYEECDSGLLQTALREAEEEIGLKAEDVEILGELDDCITMDTGYIISPFVAFIPYPYAFNPDGKEVERIVPVPLRVLTAETISRNNPPFTGEDKDKAEPIYKYGGYTIFGATARILRQFIGLLCPRG